MDPWILSCTNCHTRYPLDRLNPRCATCGEPLEAIPPGPGVINRGNPLTQTFVDRYAAFLPLSPMDRDLTLGEGFTPLIRSDRIARRLGMKGILFKNESSNPTWSFKDRGTAACVHHAVARGVTKIGTVSSGNMAASVAAYGAMAGLDTYILVSTRMPPEKINPIAIYGPTTITVSGDYGTLYYESLSLGEKNNIYFINSDVPLRVEGSKTIAFEICEQMSFAVPDYVIIPTSSGGNARGIMKGFDEFRRSGLIDRLPSFICVQAEGCSPIARAYTTQHERIEPFLHADTIAHAIENPYPPSGNEILRQVHARNSIVTAVTDAEILAAQSELASEGFFVQPAATVSLAAAVKLRHRGYLSERDTAVCILTGSGLKYTAVFEHYHFPVREATLENLEDVF